MLRKDCTKTQEHWQNFWESDKIASKIALFWVFFIYISYFVKLTEVDPVISSVSGKGLPLDRQSSVLSNAFSQWQRLNNFGQNLCVIKIT